MRETTSTEAGIIDALIGAAPGGDPPPVAWVLSALYEIGERGPRIHDPDTIGYWEMHDQLFFVMRCLRTLYCERYGTTEIPLPHKPLGPVDTSRRKAERAARYGTLDDAIPF